MRTECVYYVKKFPSFLTQKIDFESPNFRIFYGAVPSLHEKYQKPHFATFDFFVKMKLVPNVVHINATK